MSDTNDISGGWHPAARYLDPAVISLDPRFDGYKLPLAGVERLATGCRWCEGPVWFGDGRYLLWSDIPNNRIMRWDEVTDRSRSSGSRPISPTARPATGRVGWLPANMAGDA
jgi:gluconolactonase